jgi:hypothetical protein
VSVSCEVSINKSPQKLGLKTKNPSWDGLVGRAISELATPLIELVSSDMQLLTGAVLNDAASESSRSSASHTLFHLGGVSCDDDTSAGSLLVSPSICDIASGKPPEIR